MATFVRLLGWLRPYRRGVVWSGLLAAVAMVMTVAIPWLTGRAIDQIQEGDKAGLTDARARRRSPRASLRLGLTVARRLVAGRVSLGVELDLRNRMYGHLQALELGLLRPPADRPAHVARDRRPAGGALLPGLRAGLHPAVGAHHPARRGGDVRRAARAGGGLAHPGADRGLRLRALRPARAPGAAGAPAAHRRADRRRRGEHRRRARGQGLRARGPPARALPRARRARVGPGHGLHAHAGLLQPVHRLPAADRPGRDPLLRRAPGHRRAPDRRRVQRLLRLPAHAAVADAHAGHPARPRPAGHRRRRPRLPDPRPRAADRLGARRAGAAARAPATCELRGVSLQYEGAARPVLHDVDLDVPAGTHRRPRRRHRLGQDDARAAPPAPVRRQRRRGAHRRRRRARRRRRLAARRDRRRRRRPLPVQRHRGREHRLRPRRARRARRSSSRRAAPRPTTSSRACPTATTRASASAG